MIPYVYLSSERHTYYDTLGRHYNSLFISLGYIWTRQHSTDLKIIGHMIYMSQLNDFLTFITIYKFEETKENIT